MSKSKTNIVINATKSTFNTIAIGDGAAALSTNRTAPKGTTINLSLALQSRSPKALANAVRENRGSAPSMFPGVSGTVGWVK